MKRLSLTLSAAVSAALLPLAGAGAADAPAAQDRLEEIVVTAQRREEKLQDVPVSVTAFSETLLRDAGVRNTADFMALSPNVSFDQSFTVGNSFVTMRGVEQINNADSPVAIVVDGVPQGNQKQLKMELFDVERIEVLRGPQGALYGRNAIGGAINIITKQPTNDFSGFLQAGGGSGSEKFGVAAISGPIVADKLLFRLSGEYKDSDGQITNPYLNKKVDFFKTEDLRAKVTWLASDAVTMDVRVAHSKTDGGATYDVAIPNTFADPTNVQDLAPHADLLGSSHLKSDDASVKLDWKVGGGTLTAITGWTKVSEDYYGSLGFCNPVDCPGGFFGFGSLDQHQDLQVRLFSQEVRFASAANQPVRYIVGAYYLDTKRDLLTTAHLLDVPGQPELVHNLEHNKNTAWAGFGQLDIDLRPGTTLGLSARYDKDERNQTDVATGNERSKIFDAVQPKVTLSQKINDQQLGYLTFSTGFRSGGFNGVGQLAPFKRELLRNAEAGWKSTWLDQRLIVNAAAFIERDTDFQFFYVDLAAGGAQVIANLSSVELKGFELETQAVLAPGWTAYANVGILDSKIRALDPNLGVPAAVGNKTPKTVPTKFNLGSQYQWDFSGLQATVRVDWEHRGKKYWHTDNVDVMNSVNLLNARASLKWGQWQFAVQGRNLLDKYYFEDFNSRAFTGLPNNIGWPSKPRSWEASVRYDF
jgi:iron complex outermembrane receptor protein